MGTQHEQSGQHPQRGCHCSTIVPRRVRPGPRFPTNVPVPPGRPGPAGAPKADGPHFSARRGDWLLSFVYRTSSVQLRVAGLQPVLLQDRRVENVDLSSVVSIARPA